MYKKVVELDKNSFIDLSSRITGSGEQLLISLRGSKTDKDAAIASVLLMDEEIKILAESLLEWLNRTIKV